MRGKHRSTPIETLVQEAKKLAADGVKELILIAQDLTYYGLDLYKKRSLADLLRKLVTVDGIEWIRLHYAFPTGFPLDVLDVIRDEPKVCQYIDMPLQHISDNILKSMRRGTTFAKTNALLNTCKERVPNMAIRTTLIVGYPGETQEDFELLKQWVSDTRFDRLGCFTYSHEENTHAYQLVDDVPAVIKQQRANEIMAIQSQISWENNQQMIGKTLRCLVDRKEGSYYIGRSEYDSPDVDNEIRIDAKEHYLRLGDFVDVTIEQAEDFDLYASPTE